MSASADILGPDGPVARALSGRFESRPEQLEMAAAVAETMDRASHLLVEAGTGVGKSFAYLVPAIIRCTRFRQRVVISTHTIALQEQLVQKDIPLLQAALEDAGIIPKDGEASAEALAGESRPSLAAALRPVLVKGRGNYVSIRRLKLASERQDAIFSTEGARRQLHQIEDWAYTTTDGSLATLPRLEHPEVWSHVESDTDNCMGQKCPTYGKCFYQNARRAMERGNLLVCNHALFFADLALRIDDAGFLPDYDHVVLDEAHSVEEVAAEHLGLSLTEGRVAHLLRTLLDSRRGKGYLAQSARSLVSGADPMLVERAAMRVQEAEDATGRFFGAWDELLLKGDLPNGRVRRPVEIDNSLTPAMNALTLALQALRDSTREESPDRYELNAYIRRAGDIGATAEAFVKQSLPGCAYWVEVSGGEGRGRFRRVTLGCAPVDVAPILSEHLFGKPFSVTMTSATLAAGGRGGETHKRGDGETESGRRVVPVDADGEAVATPAAAASDPFGLVKTRLGCGGARALLLGSPFDYERQMEVFLDRDAPDPRTPRRSEAPSAAAPDYATALAARILPQLDATDGGAFVLFNSFATLRAVARRLEIALVERRMPMLVHEPQTPRSELLRRFREDPRSVLLGAASFWQGVDVPGHGLRNVIITQLPFEPPDRPLTEARLELVEERGGDPFRDESLPRAVIRFKQGIGRLIRSKTDTGRIVVLDPRIVTKPYGRVFLRAIPGRVSP